MEDVASVEALLLISGVTLHDGRPITESKALKLTNFATEVTSIVHCDYPFVSAVYAVINISDVFGKKHCASSWQRGRWISSRSWFCLNFEPVTALRYTSSKSGLQSFFLNGRVFSILSRILMGCKRERRRSAFHTSTIEPCSCPGQRVDCFWSVQHARMTETR